MAGGTDLWSAMRRNRNAYLFILPFYLMFLAFMLFPIGFSFVLSFQRWNGIMAANFVGLENYRQALRDPGFHNALLNTFIFAALTVVVSTALGLAMALFLNTVRVMKRFYRGIFFVPAIVSLVVVSLVWKLILNSDVGLIREGLDALARLYTKTVGWTLCYVAVHGESALLMTRMHTAAEWLTESSVYAPEWMVTRFRLLDNPVPIIPLLTITLVNVWAVVGFNTVIYLAGLQGLPSHMYDASRIDGATKLQNFRYITWPLLRPTTFFVVLMSTIDALQVFVLPQVMKQDSEDTMTVVYYLYRNAFQFYNMGYASAIAYLLFGITVVLGLALRSTLGRSAQWVHEQ
jgi:ABC-type sugar transport system permease subunit